MIILLEMGELHQREVAGKLKERLVGSSSDFLELVEL